MEISGFISSLPELIGNAVEANQWIGYGTILLAMFLENLIDLERRKSRQEALLTPRGLVELDSPKTLPVKSSHIQSTG